MNNLKIKRDFRTAWRAILATFRDHPLPFAGAVLATALLAVFVTFHQDPAWFRMIRGDKNERVREIASEIGSWGSLAQYNFLIVIGLWGIGWMRRSRFLQRLAVITFLSTVVSGAVCNVFRFTVSRPRPFTEEHHLDFRGPQFQAKYHGFPSGHTATAFGTAVPLLVALPEVGLPVTAFAVVMGWARIYDKAHYPTDVGVGAIIGILAGLAGGLPMRRLRRRLSRAP